MARRPVRIRPLPPLRAKEVRVTRNRLPWLFTLVAAFAAVLLTAWSALASTQGTWTATGPMEQARAYFTATVLRNGDVLVAGGYDGTSGNVEFKTTEMYHTATGTSSPKANMLEVRAAAVAVKLPAGRVMVIRGENFSGPLYTAEIY